MKEIGENERQTELRFIETLLLMMLREKRSWAGYMDVAQALHNIRLRAERLNVQQSKGEK